VVASRGVCKHGELGLPGVKCPGHRTEQMHPALAARGRLVPCRRPPRVFLSGARLLSLQRVSDDLRPMSASIKASDHATNREGGSNRTADQCGTAPAEVQRGAGATPETKQQAERSLPKARGCNRSQGPLTLPAGELGQALPRPNGDRYVGTHHAPSHPMRRTDDDRRLTRQGWRDAYVGAAGGGPEKRVEHVGRRVVQLGHARA